MFQEHICNKETLNLFDRDEPQFLHAVRFEIEKRLPHVKFQIFSFTTTKAQYFYGYKWNQRSRDNGIFYHKGKFHADEFLTGFHQFQEAINLFHPPKPVVFLAKHFYIEQVENYVKIHDSPVNAGGQLAFDFIVNLEQEKLLLAMPTPTLPPGYTWGVCNPDDAEFITDHWMYAPENEAENTRQKLKLLPSVCVYYERKPVAFEMIDISGSLNHQFVLKEHRGKGLGAAIEIEISKKCIKEGLIVHKNVDVIKPSIIEASRRCPYWTTIKNSDASDCLKKYLLMTGKE